MSQVRVGCLDVLGNICWSSVFEQVLMFWFFEMLLENRRENNLVQFFCLSSNGVQFYIYR